MARWHQTLALEPSVSVAGQHCLPAAAPRVLAHIRERIRWAPSIGCEAIPQVRALHGLNVMLLESDSAARWAAAGEPARLCPCVAERQSIGPPHTTASCRHCLAQQPDPAGCGCDGRPCTVFGAHGGEVGFVGERGGCPAAAAMMTIVGALGRRSAAPVRG